MPDLSFQVTGASVVEFAAAPTLGFSLTIKNATEDEEIHSIALHCQIQLEVTRRNYSPQEKQNLKDLFGEPGRWGQTLRPLLLGHVLASVPRFSKAAVVDLQVPFTFDFNIAATKYFYGLEDGEIPMLMLFSGTVFKVGPDGTPQVSMIPWDRECRFRLPVKTWRSMIDSYYPDTAWLCLPREAFNKLYRYKVENGIPTWEMAIERLLAEVHA